MNPCPVEEMPEAYYVRWHELHAKARRWKAGPSAHQALARHESLSRQEWLAQWAAELRQPPGRGRWIVTAERLPGRETLYLCKSPTQGTRMLPAAHSMAYRYGNRTYAEAEKRTMQVMLHGLGGWSITAEVGNPTP